MLVIERDENSETIMSVHLCDYCFKFLRERLLLKFYESLEILVNFVNIPLTFLEYL